MKMSAMTGEYEEKGFVDLPEVEDNIKLFSEEILKYGFSPTQVTVKKNVSYADMKDLSAEIKSKIVINKKAGRKTLMLIYYAGHGMMQNN